MQITLYPGFAKRRRSTARPTQTGATKTVTLKDSTSITKPTFTFASSLSDGIVAGTTCILWDGRYYFVDDVISRHNGVTEIPCSFDAGATYKNVIGASSVFIERCETGYDETITDPSISTSDNTYRSEIRSDAIFPSTPEKGVIALHIASNDNLSTLMGGATELVFVEPGLYAGSTNPADYDIMAKLWDNQVSQNLKNTLSDAWASIIKAIYIPCFTYDDLTGAAFITADLNLGTQTFTDVQVKTYSMVSLPTCYSHGYEFNLETIQKYSTFKWRNLDPFCDWRMYLPFYGPIDIPADMFLNYPMASHPYLYVKTSVDYASGDLVYTLYYRVYIGVNPADHLIAKYQTKLGVDITLSNIRQGNALETIGHGLSAVGAVVSRNPLAAVTEGVAGAISSMRSQVSSVGNMSTGVGIARAEWGTSAPKILLYNTGHETNTDPTNYASSIGCMFMKQDTISNHPGYIKCSNANIAIAGTQSEKDAVNDLLNGGFYYE